MRTIADEKKARRDVEPEPSISRRDRRPSHVGVAAPTGEIMTFLSRSPDPLSTLSCRRCCYYFFSPSVQRRNVVSRAK